MYSLPLSILRQRYRQKKPGYLFPPNLCFYFCLAWLILLSDSGEGNRTGNRRGVGKGARLLEIECPKSCYCSAHTAV
ncbi:hypothetical protein SUGI_1193370 [Cryptomeria japonica]|nr:hypothetical protein SUGI_1193370 [Cryptomeria japonica]